MLPDSRLIIMFFLLLVLLIISIFLEGTVTTLPLVLVCLLCLTIYKRGTVVFPIAFLAGLLLDLLLVRTIGPSSLFFIIFVFLILLYQRKYEINSYPFVAAAGFLGSAIFLLLFSNGNWFWQAVISSVIAIVFFGTLRKLRYPDIQNI